MDLGISTNLPELDRSRCSVIPKESVVHLRNADGNSNLPQQFRRFAIKQFQKLGFRKEKIGSLLFASRLVELEEAEGVQESKKNKGSTASNRI